MLFKSHPTYPATARFGVAKLFLLYIYSGIILFMLVTKPYAIKKHLQFLENNYAPTANKIL